MFAWSSSLALAQRDLCEGQNWFAQAKPKPSLLCKGVLEAAFNRSRQATLDLEHVIRSDPDRRASYRAHEVLLQMNFRQGRYREALGHADAMLAARLDAKDIVDVRPLLLGLSEYPDVGIKHKRSLLPYVPTADSNPHFKVRVNEKDGLFYADTGANISVMSDAEARSLGLEVKPVTSTMGDISGSQMSLQVANVEVLEIGKSILRHVSFVILPASQPPFNGLPVEQQALLGIQVLLALQRIHVDANGVTEIAGPRESARGTTPFVFHQSQPVIQMSFQGKAMLYTLDTGAVHTTLNPLFGETFASALTGGSTVDHPLTGVGGTTNQSSLQIPHLEFTFAGASVTLAPVIVLVKSTTSESSWAAGNLGYDLIRQTAPFTIDFSQMRFKTAK